MYNVILGIKSFFRRRSSALVSVLVSVISISLVFCNLMIGVCEIYMARSENPYSDYYRIISEYDGMRGEIFYDNIDFMESVTYGSGKRIIELFENIIDYNYVILSRNSFIVKNTLPFTTIDNENDVKFGMIAIQDSSYHYQFAKGEYTLKNGRYLNKNDNDHASKVCMISEEVALLNNISIGDKIDIQLVSNEETPFTKFEVIGIFKDEIWRSEHGKLSQNSSKNKIFIPINTYESMYENGFDYLYNFQIKLDKNLHKEIEKFANDYNVVVNNYMASDIRLIKVGDIYYSQNKGIHSLSTFFNTLQIIFIFISLIVLFSFVYSLVNSRKNEIGVYIALGIEKHEIFKSVLFELSISAFFGLLITSLLAFCFGSSSSLYVLNIAVSDISAESLKHTTLDQFVQNINVKTYLTNIIDYTFVFEKMMSSLFTFLIVFFSSVFASILKVFSSKTLLLLSTKKELSV